MKEWTLKGDADPDTISRRQTLLMAMFENAKTKSTQIPQLRQTNFNYAIIIFAAVFTFNEKLFNGWYTVIVSAALFLMMFIFSSLDRRFHRYIHGWGETEKHLTENIVNLLNEPNKDVTFRRYIDEGEETAEFCGWQPFNTYLLVAASGLYFLYCFFKVI